MSTTHTYLIVEATRRNYGPTDPETGLRAVSGVRVVATRANPPAVLKRDQVAVKVTLDVPDSTFAPIRPTAVVRIPEDLVLRGPIEADAEDPTREDT